MLREGGQWEYFSSKAHQKINAKIDVEKVREITSMRKYFQNYAKTRSKINGKSMTFQNLRFLVFLNRL